MKASGGFETKQPTSAAPSGPAGGELEGTYPDPSLVNDAVIEKLLTGYVSGAGTISATDTILQAIQKLNGNDTFDVKLTLSSAEILDLNSTPIQILSAPGVGKAYVILRTYVRYNAATTPYATNVLLRISFNGSSLSVMQNNSILTSTVTRIGNFGEVTVSGTANLQIIENTALMVNVGTGNPTGGDGTIDIYITYKTITL